MKRDAQAVSRPTRGVESSAGEVLGTDAQRELVRGAASDGGQVGRLVTASELATLCEVDLKTIHNWVDRGRIAHFRTPGRHLRFRAADVADFLRAWGYTVPREIARAGLRVALVVGTEEAAAHVSRAFGETLRVRHASHAYDALVLAGSAPADVYVVNVREAARDIDVHAMLAALRRASSMATFVALVDEAVSLPGFCSCVRRDDGAALHALAGLTDGTPPVAPGQGAEGR
jgi:excisionase family DNA binding protein